MYLGDYHTHTIYSHGKGTVEDNVLAAISRGLKEIAITDHGFRHMTYNVRRMDWPFIIEDVELMRKKYPMIQIHLGLETNFVSTKGFIDIQHSDMRYIDALVCGYHKLIKPLGFMDIFKFYIPNLILSGLGKSTKKLTATNTDAYIKALGKYDIDVIAHINHGAKVDVKAVAEAAKHYGTYIEINCKNFRNGHLSVTDKELEIIAATGAEFIVDSDAHNPKEVGVFTNGDIIIDRLGIDRATVANWDRLPSFRSRKIVQGDI